MQSRLSFEAEGTAGNLSDISALDTAALARYRWHFFKGAFSPNIVTHAIKDKRCEKDDLIVDPFSGSGTVPLTSILEGYRTAGFEVNPLGFSPCA